MSDLIQRFNDRHLLTEDETLVLAEGLDKAAIGITTIEPKQVVYDYWRCLDVLMKIKDLDQQISFDDALMFLDEYIDEVSGLNNFAPIFIKTL
jgi:hypothetical protein|tara:strand:+ start:259 stop:537 length:279 start_codon:yes stop_codon:yes gene_type:complete